MTGKTASPNALLTRRTKQESIVVTIASARPDLAAGLQATLESESDFRIAGDPVAIPGALRRTLTQHRPNVLLLEKRLFDRLNTTSKRTIHADFPNLRVLLLCDRVRAVLFKLIVRHHFHGFLLRSCAPNTIVRAIRKVSQGELWLPRAMLEKAIFEAAHNAGQQNSFVVVDANLTRREAQAVEHLCQGLTNREIGKKLGIREDTVKKHLHSAYRKLGVRCRTQLMAHKISQSH